MMTAQRKPAGAQDPTGSQSSPQNETQSHSSGPRCISCKGPGPLRTPTGHPACLDCLIVWNPRGSHDEADVQDLIRPVSVTDVTDVTDTGGKL